MKCVFNERITAMRRAFKKAWSATCITDPSILEKASCSDCRNVFAPEYRSWDPRLRSDSQLPHVSALSIASITEAIKKTSTADKETPIAEPVAPSSSPKQVSPVPGFSGVQAPLSRASSQGSGRSNKRGRACSSSSPSESVPSPSPSPPPKKNMKKKKKHSSREESLGLAEIMAQISNLQSHFSATHNNLQSTVL